MRRGGRGGGQCADVVLRELGVLPLAVPSRSRGSGHPERPMRGLVGLDGSPQGSGCADLYAVAALAGAPGSPDEPGIAPTEA